MNSVLNKLWILERCDAGNMHQEIRQTGVLWRDTAPAVILPIPRPGAIQTLQATLANPGGVLTFSPALLFFPNWASLLYSHTYCQQLIQYNTGSVWKKQRKNIFNTAGQITGLTLIVALQDKQSTELNRNCKYSLTFPCSFKEWKKNPTKTKYLHKI